MTNNKEYNYSHSTEIPNDLVNVLNFRQGVRLRVVSVAHVNPLLINPPSPDYFSQKTSFIMVETDSTYLSNNTKNEASGFYNSIFSISWQRRKTVICADPLAETENYSIGNMATLIIGTALSTYDSYKLFEIIKNKKLSRRDFLRMIRIIGTLGILRGTDYGEIIEHAFPKQDKMSPHPHISDPFSYAEFRNSSFIIGIDQLIKQEVIKAEQTGVLFVGAFHLDDLIGYQTDNQIDINKAQTVYNHNFYSQLQKLKKTPLTIRVWTPTEKINNFNLQQIPLLPE